MKNVFIVKLTDLNKNMKDRTLVYHCDTCPPVCMEEDFDKALELVAMHKCDGIYNVELNELTEWVAENTDINPLWATDFKEIVSKYIESEC